MSDQGRIVRIDTNPLAATRYGRSWAVVCVDVFRATTVVCTTAATGRRCLVAADIVEATALAAGVPGALLGGEQRGHVPPGFDVGNSPTELARRDDLDRPLVLVTSSGTPLLRRASAAGAVYAACLRNVSAQVQQLLTLNLDVVVIGAGTRGERRGEDDLGCARIAAGLLGAGYASDPESLSVIEQYGGLPTDWCASGPSARFLREGGRQDDIDFVLSHDDDVDMVFELRGAEVLGRALSRAYAH